MSNARLRFEQWVTSAWYEGAWWLWLFWPLSRVFALVTRLRRAWYRRYPTRPLPVPVAVVGGITVGGTGKTPVIIALVDALTSRGLSVGVVSRGYGGRAGDTPVLVDARSTAAQVGDEPLLIALSCHCPVAVGRDRVAAVQALAKRHSLDLILSDDGLQHYRMPRAFEIAVVDAQRQLGNGQLLPMGPLREAGGRLTTVDWVLERNGDQPATGFRYHVQQFRHWRSRRMMAPAEACERWKVSTVAGVTGLGQPEQFFQTLEQLGLTISRHAFPDHHALSRRDLDGIWSDVIVMTEKDAVKIESFDDERIWVMGISAHIPVQLVDALMARFGPREEAA